MRLVTADLARDKTAERLSLPAKVSLLWEVWRTALRVQLALRRHDLPRVASEIPVTTSRRPLPPALLGRAISRGLRVGRWRPRCLIRSLVLYQLLREQGDSAELVIGLTEQANSPDAHAWVELGGLDVGPWPGRGMHVELARYPRLS
jgi:hypothetical protein